MLPRVCGRLFPGFVQRVEHARMCAWGPGDSCLEEGWESSSFAIWAEVFVSLHGRAWICQKEPEWGRKEGMDWIFHVLSCSQEHLVIMIN